MSDKENYFSIHEMPGAELSAEKRARISQNFRAAKALLARKRPRFVVSKADQFCHKNADRFQCVDDLTSTTRIPLGEISINPPSATPATELKSIIREHGDCYYSEGKVKSSTNCLVSVQNCNMLDSFRIPTPQPECANLSDSIAQPIFLDNEDFDESILEEIDALCEQKSAVHMEGLGTDDNCHVESNAFKETSNCHGTLDSSNDIDLEIEQSAALDCTGSESMPEEYRKYLEGLNKRQREAACSNILVPLMIIAGPGSGKTSTMVGRVLVLLNEGICPAEILAMTFTTAAAAEMRDRIGAVAGKAIAKELTISTFHSFSLQLCRLHADKLGRTPEFFLYGHGQQRRAVIEAVRISGIEKCQPHDGNQHGDDAKGVELPVYLKDKAKKWQKFVVQAKASGRTPAECSRLGDEIGATILRNYNEILKSCNAFDYHDLIISSVKLLTDFPEVFEECQKSWKAIVIDEFQDTSAMQYTLLHKLASHNCITVVGDDDQTIFSFSGANISGFDSFREDFQNHKEIRLSKNYRSTRYIVEAASALIQNNVKRCQLKHVLTTNPSGSKVTVNECHNEDAQCSFVVDKILEAASGYSSTKCSYGNIAVLYRRQVSGKMFQTVFRDRKIPFNIHGVAFYRKKVVKAILAMLKTILPDCDDGSYHQVFKALLPFEKDEKKRVIAHIDKISAVRKCSFLSAASDIFNAKISGTMRRTQLGCGRKVLSTLDMISKLARREKSISAVVSSVANIIPQKYLLEQRAVIDVDGGKYLNEDNDLRSVIHYLLDDVSIFLSTKFSTVEEKRDLVAGETGCFDVLKSFIDYITLRERENFLSRKHENGDSVTLSTIHQSKGLEWDIVFIVKANESEIPLLHESNGVAVEHGTSIEEERRLLYVAMTRARKKLFILYITVDSNWQLLQPSRFLKEIPDHLQEIQADLSIKDLQKKNQDTDLSIKDLQKKNQDIQNCCVKQNEELFSHEDGVPNALHASIKVPNVSAELMDACSGYSFLRRFPSENRVVVSHLFHQWARKQAFQDPKRLIDKIGFAIDERLTAKKYKNKDVLRALKQCLKCEEALQFAEYVLRWERIPSDKRAHIMREKQEHFQKLRMESAMGSAAPSAKQIAYLQKLGCTVVPTSRLHASHLIEQYKSL